MNQFLIYEAFRVGGNKNIKAKINKKRENIKAKI